MALPAAGDIILASTIANIIAPGHTDWASSLAFSTVSGTAPALGDAVKECDYHRRGGTDGDWIDMSVQIAWGATSSYGNGGAWLMSGFPAAHASWVGRAIGWWHATDTGVNEYGGGVVWLNSATAVRFDRANGSTGDLTNTFPFTWGNGDTFVWGAGYRPA